MRTLSLGRAAITTLTALSLLAGPMLDTASAREHQTKRCAEPSADHDFGHARPGQVGLDGAALRRLLNFATSRNSSSVRVYRHGCLAATSRLDPLTQDQPVSWNSATKGVGALLVGRAIQLGKLSLDDPVATFFPHADAAHGRILLRDLITQSSGLRLSLAGDSWNAASTDGARLALHQEVVHPPGTWFEYGQHPLTLLLACVQRAVGEDLQRFAQRELFARLGISRDDWFWVRDRAGRTEGWYGLVMSPRLMPRFGQLLLDDGVWAGTRLLPSSFVRAAGSASATNGGYGYLLWTNRGDDYWVSLPGHRHIQRPLVPSAPRDLFMFAGLGGEYVYLIPSLDLVIERSGAFPSHDPDAATEGSRGDGEFNWELFRLLDAAAADAHWTDPGPYRPIGPTSPSPTAIADPEGALAGVGVGERAGGCTVVGCDGGVDLSGYERMRADASSYTTHVVTTWPLDR